jgi:hypothetical protein
LSCRTLWDPYASQKIWIFYMHMTLRARKHARPKPVWKAQNVQQQLCVTQLTITIPRSNDSNDNMLRSNRNRLPPDVFNIHDRVKCINPRSKHYGHTARVTGMGKARLHVEFENGHVGKYIDWRNAQLSPQDNRNSNATSASVRTTTTSQSEPSTTTNDLEQLTNLMEHLAFTSATVISSNYADTPRMEELLTLFDRTVRDNARMIANTRGQSHKGTSPSSPPSS